MENKKALSFTLGVTAIILSVVLFKQFDFEKLKFEKPAIAIVYIIGFSTSILFLIKNSNKQPEK